MRVLLMDTCGENSGIALCDGGEVRCVEDLADRSASAEIIAAVRRLLAATGWQLRDLDGIGIVNGPGSFTGVRAGLAAAKGLCEATGVKLAAVSRLAVLAEAAELEAGFAALYAGRGELYIRDIASGHEALTSIEAFIAHAAGKAVVLAEERVAAQLAELSPKFHPLHVTAALPLILRQLQQGGDDPASLDANYVRSESDIYGKPVEAR